MSAFADDEIIKLAQTEFIPCSMDDWYQRRRNDAEGKFFQSVAAQGPRKAPNGTRQGIYTLTADGELLVYRNAGDNAEATRQQLRDALAKWQKLPAARRQPGALTIPPHGPLDPNYARTPPEGGLVLKMYGRILRSEPIEPTGQLAETTPAKPPAKTFAKDTCDQLGGDKAFRDFLWITADEQRQLAPPAVGQSKPMPAKVVDRIIRYHLVDASRGEPVFWDKKDVVAQSFTLTTLRQGPEGVVMRLDGQARIAAGGRPDDAERGFDARLRGHLRWQPATQSLDEFELVAVGDYWGDSSFTKGGARPGRNPIGFLFRLVDPQVSANRVYPQGAREIGAYYGRY